MSEKAIDQALVDQALKGDREAFDVLVLKYENRLMSSISYMLDDRQQVADLVQETFIKAFRCLNSFKGNSSFYTWLYRIALNTTRSYVRDLCRQPNANAHVEYVEAETKHNRTRLTEIETPEGVCISNETEAALMCALDNLSEELRVSIILRELGGLSYEEIAQVLSVPVGTVRSRISRARVAVERSIN